jgi:bzd-type benzoyl-CoA reductase N subunit
MVSDIKSEAFKKFTRAASNIRNSAVKQWHKQGGRVVGYFCSFIPEEVIIAAGLLPFRMRGTGSTGTEQSDAYFSQVSCSFPRHCFNQALVGEFDFLDGLVVGCSCDHLRHIYDNWRHSSIKTPFVHMLNRPHMSGEAMVDFYRSELVSLMEGIEENFKVKFSDEHLWKAIKLCNETRRLQQKLYELRKDKYPPITGAETVMVMVAGTAMPKEDYNKGLKELLDELSQVQRPKKYAARLMIVGADLDDPFLCNLIEDQGGIVVTDQTCFGTRIMWELVDEADTDPLRSIAKYYVTDRVPCPRTMGELPRRVKFIEDMSREFDVDGVIVEWLVSCDVWSGEHFMLKPLLKEIGIPYLALEREYVPTFTGQLRTRIQAFLEMIKE